MSTTDGVRVIDVEDEIAVTLDRELYNRLKEHAAWLSADLGFTVTVANTVGFLHKRVVVDFPVWQKQWQQALQERSATLPAPVPTPIKPTFENDFAAIEQIPDGMTVSDIGIVRNYMHGAQGVGNKINAIKHVREKTQMGLKDAKDWCEKHFKS